jgi:hypothetical protein
MAAETTPDVDICGPLRNDCVVLARQAWATGIPVPAAVAATLAGDSDDADPIARTQRLAAAYAELIALVGPATPQGLRCLNGLEGGSGTDAQRPLRVVRQITICILGCLGAFLGAGLSPHVRQGAGNIFESSGLDLLVNETFLVAAAGIGACFGCLFRLVERLKTGDYDPRTQLSTWLTALLGAVAGPILAVVVPEGLLGGGFTMDRPLLALVGGFSAELLYRMLARLSNGEDQRRRREREQQVGHYLQTGGRLDGAVGDEPSPAQRRV